MILINKKLINACFILILVVVYTFITVSYIFHLPRYTVVVQDESSVFSHQKSAKSASGLPFTKRTDKVYSGEKRTTVPAAAQLIPFILLLISAFGALAALRSFAIMPHYLLTNRQYSYLSFCIIRI